MEGFEVPYGFRRITAGPADAWYYNDVNTPYTNVAQAKTQTTGIRYQGMVLNVAGVNYVFKNGILDADLVQELGAYTFTNGIADIGSGVVEIGGGPLTHDTDMSGAFGFSFGDAVDLTYFQVDSADLIFNASQSLSLVMGANVIAADTAGWSQQAGLYNLNDSDTGDHFNISLSAVSGISLSTDLTLILNAASLLVHNVTNDDSFTRLLVLDDSTDEVHYREAATVLTGLLIDGLGTTFDGSAYNLGGFPDLDIYWNAGGNANFTVQDFNDINLTAWDTINMTADAGFVLESQAGITFNTGLTTTPAIVEWIIYGDTTHYSNNSMHLETLGNFQIWGNDMFIKNSGSLTIQTKPAAYGGDYTSILDTNDAYIPSILWTKNYIKKAPVVFSSNGAATFTVLEANNGQTVDMNRAGAQAVALSNLSVGFQMTLFKTSSSGTITFTGATNLRAAGGLTNFSTQYGRVYLMHKGSNEWFVYGDLT